MGVAFGAIAAGISQTIIGGAIALALGLGSRIFQRGLRFQSHCDARVSPLADVSFMARSRGYLNIE